jgi:hypothetical protein
MTYNNSKLNIKCGRLLGMDTTTVGFAYFCPIEKENG